jgi:hypothetical protein
MKYLWQAAVLFLGINAVLYGTREVWPTANYETDISAIQRATALEQQGR